MLPCVDVWAILRIASPTGPPFGNLKWGLTASRVSYDPPALDTSELKTKQMPAQGEGQDPYVIQEEPARHLVNLKSIPIAIITSEASYHASYDHCTVRYLAQAGVRSTFIRLPDVGIRGNGHMMMLEKNSDAIAKVMADWLDRALPGGPKKARSANAQSAIHSDR